MELSTALRPSPGSAQPALPGRHEEGGRLLSSAQEGLAESTVTQGSGCGPHVVTTGRGSPTVWSPPGWVPKSPHCRNLQR